MKPLKELILVLLLSLMVGMSIRVMADPLDLDAWMRGSTTTYYPTINGSGIPNLDKPRITERRGRLHTTIPGTDLPDLGSEKSLGYKAQRRYRYNFK